PPCPHREGATRRPQQRKNLSIQWAGCLSPRFRDANPGWQPYSQTVRLDIQLPRGFGGRSIQGWLMTLFPTTIAGSLPKPAWLAEQNKLWPAWQQSGPAL